MRYKTKKESRKHLTPEPVLKINTTKIVRYVSILAIVSIKKILRNLLWSFSKKYMNNKWKIKLISANRIESIIK
jgi:hypothetical protein